MKFYGKSPGIDAVEILLPCPDNYFTKSIDKGKEKYYCTRRVIQ